MTPIEEKYEIIIIAAVSENHVIGINNTIPWDLPEDLKRFKKLTSNHTVIMGRKTYESIGRPLPNRHNIVLSNTLKTNEVKVSKNLKEALDSVPYTETKVFIIGGEKVYEEALNIADTMYLTVVPGMWKGDAYFPEFDEEDWTPTNVELLETHQFITLKRLKDESSPIK